MNLELFRSLDETEEQEFRQWARDNFKTEDTIRTIWHPVIQDECKLMIEEKTPLRYQTNGGTWYR